jgi:hypothetical protein
MKNFNDFLYVLWIFICACAFIIIGSLASLAIPLGY